MKQIIIFLLVIIAFLIAFGQYKQYKRFNLSEYQYTANENVDLNYHDRSFLLDYYQAIENLNGYVIMQWSTEGMDVRNPEDDDEEDLAAALVYNDKLGTVKFYEDQLIKSTNLKKEGLTNDEIKFLEANGKSLADHTTETKQETFKELLRSMFHGQQLQGGLQLGSRSALVNEIQKMLVRKGHDIPVDGVFKNVTINALRAFEEKNGLFPDGKLDALTFEALLK